MRLFPRTARHRLLVAGIASSLVMGAVSVPLANADDLKDKQRDVESRIDEGQHALEESSSRLRRAVGRLQAARADLARARNHLERTKERLDAARERNQQMLELLERARDRLAQAEAELAQGERDLAEQREAVTDMVTEIYEEGDPQLRAFSSFLSAQSSSDLTWTQEGQSVMVGRQTRAYDELRAAEVLLQVRRQQRKEAEAEVQTRQEEAAAHVAVMRDLTGQARDARADVRRVVGERRSATQAAARARARDKAQLERLRAQEKRIKEMIARRAARAARSGGGYRGTTGSFLSWPIQGGYVTSSFGMRTHPIYGYYSLHNGTDFGGGCGLPLVAAAGGRVVAKYYSSVYGNRLFVYVGNVNGKSVTTVYNHASGYRVGVGSTVGRGQVIGYSGNSGWSTACHLHFTVLVGGRPVNPMNWL